ncbi:MAG: hypothetical protein WDA09_08525 [Bacteriovoracaceae bacterium]
MKFLTALVLALPLSSFAANYAACDLYKFTYDSADNLIDSKRISNTWDRLAGNGDILLEDRVEDVSYSVTFSLKGQIFGSLRIGNDSFEIKSWSDINETLRISVRDRDNKGQNAVYTLSCELDS